MKTLVLVSISLGLAFLNTLIIHVIKTKFPKFYFSLGELVVTDKEDISFSGLLTKFTPPIFIAIIIGVFFKSNGLELTILFGFFASFLVVWPVILSGDELLSWEAKKKINVLYLIYFFYILAYITFSLLGFLIGKSLRGVRVTNFFSNIMNAYTSWSPFFQAIVTNIISGIIVALLAFVFTRIFRSLIRILNRKMADERDKLYEAK